MGINLKQRSKLWLAGGASVLALGMVGGAAIAAGDGNDGRRAERAAAVSEYLGLPSEDVREARQGGTSLAQLAQQEGVSVEGLEAVIVADASEHLDEAVADGRISEERAQDMLSQLEDRVSEMVQSTDAPERGHHGPGGPGGPGGPEEEGANATTAAVA